MKPVTILYIVSLAVRQAASHSTFQELWVNGVDEMSPGISSPIKRSLQKTHQGYCVRLPPSNSPVTDVTSTDLRCNVNGLTGVANKCTVPAGGIVTVEMHGQPGDRSCTEEAIGGAHYGPVQVYLTKVADASTADGSTGWFKIFKDDWSAVASASNAAADKWGTNDLNACCGKMDVKLPADIPAGDYLLRSEVIALHVAGSLDGAQFYMSCYQITVTGGGSASPATVNFPGAYNATDPGILIDIYESISTYIAPGPTVYSGGGTKSSGATCTAYELGTTTGASYTGGGAASSTGTTLVTKATTSTTSGATTTKATTSTTSKSSSAFSASSTGASSGCTAALYGQCGGTGWTGCTSCASGSICSAVSPPYYS